MRRSAQNHFNAVKTSIICRHNIAADPGPIHDYRFDALIDMLRIAHLDLIDGPAELAADAKAVPSRRNAGIDF